MDAAEVLAEAERRGVDVRCRGDRLIYRGSSSALSPDFMESLRHCKPEILSILLEREAALWERKVATQQLLGWASKISEDEIVLQSPVRFNETPLRPLAVTEVSRFALGQLKLITQCRFQQQTDGLGRFRPEWWRAREEEALFSLASLKEAMDRI